MDRSDIDFRRITLSNSDYVGRELHELRMEERFDAVVSRVRRGDIDIIATPDLVLQSGDRLRVTAPRERLAEITKDLGDSERTAGDINPIGLGLGLTLGLLLAFVQIPLPGGGTLVLGTATAPLVLGVVLGAIGRTGPMIWALPGNVANTLNQFSLLVFLVAVGTGAGSGLVTALSADGLQLVIAGSGDLGGARAGLRDRAAHGAALRHRASTRRTDRIPAQPGAVRVRDGQGARSAGRGRLRRAVPGEHDPQGVPGAADGRLLLIS